RCTPLRTCRCSAVGRHETDGAQDRERVSPLRNCQQRRPPRRTRQGRRAALFGNEERAGGRDGCGHRGDRTSSTQVAALRARVRNNESEVSMRKSGGGRGIRTPKGLAARWISSPLPCQLRLALLALKDSYLRYSIWRLGRRDIEPS